MPRKVKLIHCSTLNVHPKHPTEAEAATACESVRKASDQIRSKALSLHLSRAAKMMDLCPLLVQGTSQTHREAKAPAMTVFAGPTGSGKSSLMSQAGDWLQNAPIVAMRRLAPTGDEDEDERAFGDALDDFHERCERKVHEAADFAFESTLALPVKQWLLLDAYRMGYRIRAHFICTECPTVNAARIMARTMAGGHPIALPAIQASHARSLAALPLLLRLSEFTCLWDNSRHGEAPRLACRWSNGTPEWTHPAARPAWAELAVSHVPDWDAPIAREPAIRPVP